MPLVLRLLRWPVLEPFVSVSQLPGELFLERQNKTEALHVSVGAS
jgi:hypothetical protein